MQSNGRQLSRLLRTLHAPEERPAAAWDVLKLVRAAQRKRLGLDPLNDDPLDTPHRRLASSLESIRHLVDSSNTLLLSKEQTQIMQTTELMRRNILAVTSAVHDFIVRSSASPIVHFGLSSSRTCAISTAMHVIICNEHHAGQQSYRLPAHNLYRSFRSSCTR